MVDCCRSELKTRGAVDRHLQNYQTGTVSIFEVARDESMQKNLLHRAKGVFQYIYRI